MATSPTSPGTIEPLDPDLIDALEDPSSYPHDDTAKRGIEHIQTHISHVFLTRDWVYKFRKAVSLSFLDLFDSHRSLTFYSSVDPVSIDKAS